LPLCPVVTAPEVLAQQPYDEACDLWSLGVITYVMLCGFTPFEGQTSRELYKNIIAVNYSFPDPYWTKISSEAKDLIRRLLVPNPKDRLKVADVLAHPPAPVAPSACAVADLKGPSPGPAMVKVAPSAP